MASNPTISQLKVRLDDLDRRLARARQGGSLSAEHHERAASIDAAARALREKIAATHESAIKTMRRELHEDWEILVGSLERWERDVDAHFRSGRSGKA